ncbi:PaaI family thioesterase [Aquabacterium sp. A7-Y]|uniref:PaaI family thioesterase n=1 Tax=Aquabacterium sp. A7-Y TaxID=1349605 RepID=UPI00223CE306|nr:PaaI family thioesterase [Aquabacterium sp. A7-Y]MCW7539733.1 PaaI family thioesterase [Aquabacterium sp. A7-Y]
MAERIGPFWDVVAGRIPAPSGTRLLGWQLLEVDPEAGRIRLQFEASDDFLNLAGMVQGGFLSAMLDEVMGQAALATLGPGQFVPTLEAKVSYMRSTRPGPVLAEAHVVQRSTSICYLAGELRNPRGDLLATATATAMIVSGRLAGNGGAQGAGAPAN